jgi:hypothetical protein
MTWRLLLFSALAAPVLSKKQGCTMGSSPRMVNQDNLGMNIVAEEGNFCQVDGRKASDDDKVIVSYEACSDQGEIFDIAPHGLPAIVTIGAETKINGASIAAHKCTKCCCRLPQMTAMCSTLA